MAKPKKAKQNTKGAKEPERSPEPELPPLPATIQTGVLNPRNREPLPHDQVSAPAQQDTSTSASNLNVEIAPVPSQVDGRNLDQDHGSELGVLGSWIIPCSLSSSILRVLSPQLCLLSALILGDP